MGSLPAEVQHLYSICLFGKCADPRVSHNAFYKTFAGTKPSDKGVVRSIIVLLKFYRWHKFSIVCRNTQQYETVARSLQEKIQDYPNFTINHNDIIFFEYPQVCCEDRKPCCTYKFPEIVEETKKFTRVYVFFGAYVDLIEMLTVLQMKKLLEKGEYVIIYIDLEIYSPSLSYKYLWRKPLVEPYIKAASAAARSLLVIVPSPPQDQEEFENKFENKVREYNRMKPFNFPNDSKYKKHITEYAAYLYDSVILYATALTAILESGGSPTNGTEIIRRIISRKRYESVTGSMMKIDENGDVEGNYTLLARRPFPPNLTLKGYTQELAPPEHVMLPVASFQHDDTSKELISLYMHEAIDWIGGKTPLDEPPCGFDGSLCIPPPDTKREVISGVLIAILFVVSLTSFIFYKNWKYEQEIEGLQWKIAYEDLLFGSGGVQPSSSRVTIILFLYYQSSISSKFPLLEVAKSNDIPYSQQETSLASQMSFESRILGQIFTKIVMYKGTWVATKTLTFSRRSFEIPRETKKEMRIMRELHHDNINQFIGACQEANCIYIISEYCSKGSLQDILENDNIKLEHMLVASLVFDLIKAMIFLHESDLKVHGNLKSSNCVVTSRWVLQVTDFGLRDLYETSESGSTLECNRYRKLLWKAPEILRDPPAYPKGTQKGDVYSFAIIMHEIIFRQGPYGNCSLTPQEIAAKVKSNPGDSCKPFRPSLDGSDSQEYIIKTIEDSWCEKPECRPDFRHIRRRLHKMRQGMKSNIMDNMMAIMEKQANHLEELVDERTALLHEEKKKTEALLHRMLPKSVAEQLMKGEAVIPESFDAVTIYFSDIVGFTEMSATSTPMEVVTFLNDLYTVFDSIIGHYDVYKVETIGDAYMVVSGLPKRNEDKHAGVIASMSLELLDAVTSIKIRHKPSQTLKLRIGIHTGPVVAGVVGLTMPRYCLFGDTVNTASRMESNGEALKIHISNHCQQHLERLGGYQVEDRGFVKIKGKGELKTYWLLGHEESGDVPRVHPKDLILPQPLFTVRDSESRRRSPKLEYARRGSLAFRGDSGNFRFVDDLTPPISNGSVPGIPVFLRVPQDSPRTPKRFSPQVNNRDSKCQLKEKDCQHSRDSKAASCDCGDMAMVDGEEVSSSTHEEMTQNDSAQDCCEKEEDMNVISGVNGNVTANGGRRHRSGGDCRFLTERNKTSPVAYDETFKPLLGLKEKKIVCSTDNHRLKPPVLRLPSKRWRSCDEIDTPKGSKASLIDWFTGLFGSRLPETEIRRPNNFTAGMFRPLKERDKEESVV